MIIDTTMEIDQIDDSVIDMSLYSRVVTHNIKEKDFFKAALEYQESVKERYEIFFLQLFADFDLNQQKVSEGVSKMAIDLEKDILAFSKLAKTIPKHSDKKCDPIAIWPDIVLSYCDQLAERFGYGDEELTFCKCYNIDTKILTRRKPILKIKGNADENYEKVDFSKGIAPKEEFPNLPQRAMMDLGATFKAKSYWDGNWKNPRLDARYGTHNQNG